MSSSGLLHATGAATASAKGMSLVTTTGSGVGVGDPGAVEAGAGVTGVGLLAGGADGADVTAAAELALAVGRALPPEAHADDASTTAQQAALHAMMVLDKGRARISPSTV